MEQPGDVRAGPAVTTLEPLGAELPGLAEPDEARCDADGGPRARRRGGRGGDEDRGLPRALPGVLGWRNCEKE